MCEYAVICASSVDQVFAGKLKDALDDGWAIERVDTSTGMFVYILKRMKEIK